MIEEKVVRSYLRGGTPWRIMACDVVDSTMNVAQRMSEEGCDSYTVVVADQQTSGTGRFDRPWDSPAGGGLWMTAVVRPAVTPDQAPWFTLASAVAVAQALTALEYSVGIKWPNDVLAATKGHWRKKLCGIRAEMRLCEEKLDWVSIGIGLNTSKRVFPRELERIATSLEDLTGKLPDRELVMATILDRLEENCLLLEGGGGVYVREAWLAYALGLGEDVVVRDVDGEQRGVAVGLADDGCLLMRQSPDAEPVSVLSGDLIFRV